MAPGCWAPTPEALADGEAGRGPGKEASLTAAASLQKHGPEGS